MLFNQGKGRDNLLVSVSFFDIFRPRRENIFFVSFSSLGPMVASGRHTTEGAAHTVHTLSHRGPMRAAVILRVGRAARGIFNKHTECYEV